MSILGKIILWFFGSIVAFAIVYLLIELITSIRKKRLAAPHLALINHENPEVREAAIMALGDIGHKSAVPALIKALNDPNSSVRAAAAQALGKIHDQESLPGLTQTAIHDEVAQVRFASVEALRLIGRIYENYIVLQRNIRSCHNAEVSQLGIAVTNISDIIAFLVVLDHVKSSGWIKNGSRQNTRKQEVYLVKGQGRRFVFELDTQSHQEVMG
jgi:hypothetical protein